METKAAAIIFLRQLFQQASPENKKTFLAQLTNDESEQYKDALPMSWLPAPTVASLLAKGTRILYAGDSAPLQTFGRAQAKNDLQGVYRVLLKVINIPMLVGQTAKLWEKYYKQGKAHSKADLNAKRASMTVDGLAGLPLELQQLITGYLYGALDLTGVKNVKVTQDASDVQSWKWVITWE